MVGSCIDIFTFVLYVVVQGCLYLSIFILEEPEYNINIIFEETTWYSVFLMKWTILIIFAFFLYFFFLSGKSTYPDPPPLVEHSTFFPFFFETLP